jgi:hypothetical protein
MLKPRIGSKIVPKKEERFVNAPLLLMINHRELFCGLSLRDHRFW